MSLTRLALDCSPLLVATLHGYGAAWLAVKMLFRPLNPVYVLGKKLPFTPGILPGERDRFVDTLAGIVAEQLLTTKVIREELTDLELEDDVEALARARYAERSRPEAITQIVSTQLIEILGTLKQSSEAKLQMTREVRILLDRQLERDYQPAIRYVANLVLTENLILRIVDRTVNEVAEVLGESLAIRDVLSQVISQLPEAIFTGDQPLQKRVVRDLILRLSQRLDFKSIIKRRFDTFSNEMFEQIIYETAGREIQGIMRFGTLIGFFIGLVQTFITLGRHLFET